MSGGLPSFVRYTDLRGIDTWTTSTVDRCYSIRKISRYTWSLLVWAAPDHNTCPACRRWDDPIESGYQTHRPYVILYRTAKTKKELVSLATRYAAAVTA